MTDETRKALALKIANKLKGEFHRDLYGLVWDVHRAAEVIAEALSDTHHYTKGDEIMNNDIKTVKAMIPVDRKILLDGLRFVRLGIPLRGEQFLVGEGTFVAFANWKPADGPRIIVEPVAPIPVPNNYEYGGYGIVPNRDGIFWLGENRMWYDAIPLRPQTSIDGGRRHWARKKAEEYKAYVLGGGIWRAEFSGSDDKQYAEFSGPNAEQYAREHAARLNVRKK